MSTVDSLNGTVPVPAGGVVASSAVSSGELAKLESQLSDWVHCPSSKTEAGKEKIAEITDKIDTAKAQIKKAEDSKAEAQPSPPKPALRFDGLGTLLDAQA